MSALSAMQTTAKTDAVFIVLGIAFALKNPLAPPLMLSSVPSSGLHSLGRSDQK